MWLPGAANEACGVPGHPGAPQSTHAALVSLFVQLSNYHGSVFLSPSPRREVKDVGHKDTYSYKQGGSAPPAIETGG